MLFIIFYLFSLVVGMAVVLIKKIREVPKIAEMMLRFQLVINLFIANAFGFFGHIFMSEEVAAQIGWASNGFQKEIGYISLGIAICSFMCIWKKGWFWVPVIIISSTFYLGATFTHIAEMIQANNLHPYNVLIVIPDVFTALTLLGLWIVAFPALKDGESLPKAQEPAGIDEALPLIEEAPLPEAAEVTN